MKWTFLFVVLAVLTQACSSRPSDSNNRIAVGSGTANAIFLSDDGQDERVEMTNTSASPWDTIGRLSSDVGTCTATLVGRYLAVTAAHCVVQNGHTVPVTLQLGYNQGSFIAQASSTQIAVGTLNPNTDSRYSWDWAVIVLDTPLGDTYGWMGVMDLGAISSPVQVQYAGYSDNFENTEVAGVDTNCFLRTSFSDGTWGHDCSMGPGGSGGPLFTADTDQSGGYHIVAINTRGYEGSVYSTYTTDNANIAVMSNALVNKVLQYQKLYDSP